MVFSCSVLAVMYNLTPNVQHTHISYTYEFKLAQMPCVTPIFHPRHIIYPNTIGERLIRASGNRETHFQISQSTSPKISNSRHALIKCSLNQSQPLADTNSNTTPKQKFVTNQKLQKEKKNIQIKKK